MQLTVVIPTYNEAGNLPQLVAAIFSLPLANTKILIIDDNSPDGTAGVATELASEYPGRMCLHVRPEKAGLGTAYLCGFRQAIQAGADAIAQMDADFSHPPNKLVQLVAVLDDCDFALGSRYIEGGQLDQAWPLWRRGLSHFGNLYARSILDMHIRDVTGGFRVWRRETLQGMPLERVRSNGYVFQIEMAYLATRLGYRTREVPIYFADRRWGESKMSLKIQLEAALRVWLVRYAYRDLDQN